MPERPIDKLTLDDMRNYLRKSLSSVNRNKLNGLLAEVEFRRYISGLGFADRVSPGGWIARSESRGGLDFAAHAIVFFPETIVPEMQYGPDRQLPTPHSGLHTICSTFHQIGIHSYFCAAREVVARGSEPPDVTWNAVQLGLPTQQPYQPFPQNVSGFTSRERRYQFLRSDSDSSQIPEVVVPEEFSKENARVAFSNMFLSEMSDLDGLFWGQQRTYPIEIKEKTAAHGRSTGDYFGLDVGPFVKLAYYAAKRGNLHSLFVVREIDAVETRNLVNWWYIPFDELAQYASWNFVRGGRNMQGGASATIPIPKSRFSVLDCDALKRL